MASKFENFTSEDLIEKSLLDNDIHYLFGDITEENTALAIKWILHSNLKKKPKRTLTLYINSYGGDVYQMFALIDVIKNSYHRISTIGIGSIMSAALLILASGAKGHRYLGKNTGIMNHQHSDALESKMHDLRASMKENVHVEQRCFQILREATGFSLAEVRKKFNNPSDQYFTAKQLIDLKVADHIL
tara:strand:- start:2485 stop:3048 length:564 start_codon:yes stop_codon:yes gene_type:complete